MTPDPRGDAAHGYLCLVRPLDSEIYHLIPDLVGHPAASQAALPHLRGAPSAFFGPTYSSMSSATTSFFSRSDVYDLLTFSSRAAAWRFNLDTSLFPDLWKTIAPCSKNCFCQR